MDLLPDYTVTGEQMHEYGYTWDGMLPVRVRTARVLYAAGVELHKLSRNDTDSLVRKSYKTQKAQDLVGLVLFCCYILWFAHLAEYLNLGAAFIGEFQKTTFPPIFVGLFFFCAFGGSRRAFFIFRLGKYP